MMEHRMNLEDETNVEDPEADAAFGEGFDAKNEKPAGKAKPEPAAEKPRETEQQPEYVQITKADWDEMRATAAKSASHDQQLSKAFGTIGGLQRTIASLQSQTPRGTKVDLKEAFAEMEKDFPELAYQSRAAFEKVFAGLTGTGSADVDEGKLSDLVTTKAREITRAHAIEALEDAHPDWRAVVGAVAAGEQPDPNNPFRKWLTTQDATYQARVNGAESADVISRAITRFQTETTKPLPKPTPRADARRVQLAAAVQPRGDGGKASPDDSAEAAFAAGFNS